MDQYLWLEEVEGADALQFVERETQMTKNYFRQNPIFQKIKQEVQEILGSEEKSFTSTTVAEEFIYDFTRTKDQPKGLLRRCLASDLSQPQWELIFDFSRLEEPWTYSGFEFFKHSESHQLQLFIYLSFGGKDLHQIREFDLNSKEWVSGFDFPISKNSAVAINQDELILTAGEVTSSGYPREVFLLKRGQKLTDAKKVFEIPEDWTFVFPLRFFDFKNQKQLTLLRAGRDFYYSNIYIIHPDLSHELIFENVKVDVHGLKDNQLLVQFFDQYQDFKKDSIAYFDLKSKQLRKIPDLPSQVYLQDVTISKGRVFAFVLENVRMRVYALIGDDTWQPLSLVEDRSWNFFAKDHWTGDLYLRGQSFLHPDQIVFLEDQKVRILKNEKVFFDSQGLREKLEWCVSEDGTKIPYTVMGDFENKPKPTVINAYGGFYLSRLPAYAAQSGKIWLEKGGLFVVANIRGGAEFGSDWHDQVTKENRMKCFEDLAAVAKDLVKKAYSTKEQLGIVGGSNGGLLVSATAVHFPDVCSAVSCQVPLIDMERYHLLLAGISWAAEYGTVEDSDQMKAAIEAYNPFRQVKKDGKYPAVFFQTSTYDDRVHPGHARRMFARMKEQGHKVFYAESFKGGHTANLTPEERAEDVAMTWTFFAEKLGLSI